MPRKKSNLPSENQTQESAGNRDVSAGASDSMENMLWMLIDDRGGIFRGEMKAGDGNGDQDGRVAKASINTLAISRI